MLGSANLINMMLSGIFPVQREASVMFKMTKRALELASMRVHHIFPTQREASIMFKMNKRALELASMRVQDSA